MMRKYVYVLVGILMTVSVLFSACGAKSADTAGAAVSSLAVAENTAFPAEAPAEMAQSLEESKAEPEAPDPLANRKIVRHVGLSLESMEFDQAISQIKSTVANLGGYIETQSLDGKSISYTGDYYERYANFVARIPSEKLDEATSSLSGFCNVVSQNESTEDITDSYFDAQAHLDTLKIQEERLLEILKKAEKLEDVITLETALSEVRYQIESLTASLKRMDSQVTFSYLNIDLCEVAKYRQQSAVPKTFGDKLAAAFGRSGSYIAESLQGMLIFLVEAGPVIIVWGAIIFGIVLVILNVWRMFKQRHIRKNSPPPPKAKAPESKQD